MKLLTLICWILLNVTAAEAEALKLVSSNIINTKVTVTYNTNCYAILSYAKSGSEDFREFTSPSFTTTHNFEIPDDCTACQLKVTAQDATGKSKVSDPLSDKLSKMAAVARVFPGGEWARATPEAQGVSSNSLKQALDFLKKNIGSGIDNTAIIKNGYLIHSGRSSKAQVWAASATKSFTSTVLGLLIDQGKIKLTDKVSNYVPELKSKYPDVQFRHFTTMTSGYDAVGGSYGWNRQDGSGTPYNVAFPSFAPGTHFAYWDDAMNQFANGMSQVIKENFSNVFKREIGKKIGMKDYSWTSSWSYKNIPVSSGAGSPSGPIRVGAQDMARFGYLFLNKGNWNGTQLISESWVREATRVQVPATMPVSEKTQGWIGVGAYGYNWWVNGILPSGKRLWPDLPSTSFAARGTNGNMCVVIPDWNLVFVRMGSKGSNSQTVINGTLKILGNGLKP